MLDEALYRVLAVACAVVALAGLLTWRRRGSGLSRLVLGACLPLCALAVAAWVARWVFAGHLPIFGTYESALSLAVAVLLAGAAWEVRAKLRLGVAPIAAAIAGGLLAHGLGYDRTAYALTISERSWVVDVHAVVAWAAFGALALNAGLSLRALMREEAAGLAVPRTLEVGFILHSAMMASGSFYKFLLFGKAWSFDPIEILGLIAWLAYGAVMHMHLFAGWKGKRLAGWCLFVFALLVISYRGIVYFPGWSTYHIFDINLREHVMR
ncbi:MAG: cytochrome c biogenesis protein CcsA [Myxococcales bacterium]|nr:cytochrome c biogenesis protein CcsA [Myxococcales bacterium]